MGEQDTLDRHLDIIYRYHAELLYVEISTKSVRLALQVLTLLDISTTNDDKAMR